MSKKATELGRHTPKREAGSTDPKPGSPIIKPAGTGSEQPPDWMVPGSVGEEPWTDGQYTDFYWVPGVHCDPCSSVQTVPKSECCLFRSQTSPLLLRSGRQTPFLEGEGKGSYRFRESLPPILVWPHLHLCKLLVTPLPRIPGVRGSAPPGPGFLRGQLRCSSLTSAHSVPAVLLT